MKLLTLRLFRFGFCFLALALPAWAQGTISTIAGSTWTFTGDGGPASQAPLVVGAPRMNHSGFAADIAADSAGVVVADGANSLVVRIAPNGILHVIAGNGQRGFSGNGGPATAASLNGPGGVAVDSAGNIYIADTSNYRIRKVDVNGTITTLAGNGTSGFSGDGGPATAASLSETLRIAVDDRGNVYFTTSNNRIRKVTAAGVITTVAGNGQAGFSGDGGPATAASLDFSPGRGSVALDAAGNLYIADENNQRIRRVDPGGIITTVAGTGSSGFSGDGGPATGARLASPDGISVDAGGNLYIAEENNYRVRKVSANGIITTIAGNGVLGFSGDGGPATAAALGKLFGVAVDAAGNVYIADSANGRVRKVSANGTISTLAGNGLFKFSGDGGPGSQAHLNEPNGVAVDGAGNVYIADTLNNRIRRVGPGGAISTVAGSGVLGFSGDGGPATAALLAWPEGPLALDAAGSLYFTDRGNHRVRRVSRDGTISTVAGSGSGFSGDGGPAAAARLNWPLGVALDAGGNLYIADQNNYRIRRVDARGVITTVAGNGVAGFGGDGGPATAAALNYPNGISLDAAGNLYIADSDNDRVRKVDAAGTITTVAGSGRAGFSGDGGPATVAALNNPSGVAVDAWGNLYVADHGNDRVRRVTPNGTISTVAGGGTRGFSGDGGPATQASLWWPWGVAVDAAGNLFIADSGNDRIRYVAASSAAVTPLVNAGGVVNGASYTAPISPGGIASLFGSNLATSTMAAGLPLPPLLGGVTVKINGVAAPLFFVSPSQINFQVPWELLGQAQGSITVTLNGVTSSSQTISLGPAPGLFSVNSQGTGQGSILVANSDIVAAPEGSIPGRNARPAKRGEFLSIFCSGLGDVTNRPPSGAPPPASALSATTATTAVRIGGIQAAAVFSGLAPGFVGLYQVNVQVPDSAPIGAAVPVVLTIGGASSNSVTIAVQ
jgi:uncharacterized protein (TIGR03437 family)